MNDNTPAPDHVFEDLQEAAQRATASLTANMQAADEHTLAKARDAAHQANALVEFIENALQPDVPA
jgi:hypothetical protein